MTAAAAWSPTPKQGLALSCPVYELLYGGAAGGGKALGTASMIPTPAGWKRNGDLKTGDYVLSADGSPTRVEFAHPVEVRRAYEVCFSDGSRIVASDNHKWKTVTSRDGQGIRTTDEIRKTSARLSEERHSIVSDPPSESAAADYRRWWNDQTNDGWVIRNIVAVEDLGMREVRCITVAASDGMYLAGEKFIPTHNSDFMLVDFLPQLLAATEQWKRDGIPSRGRALLIRKEFPRLKDLIMRAAALFPSLSPTPPRWVERDHAYIFPCGYGFEFGHLEGPGDHEIYLGREFTWLGFDQVEEVPQLQYEFLKLRVRSPEPALQPLLRVRSTANPMGRHVDWVKKRFVEPCREGFKIIEETIKTSRGDIVRGRVFIPATLYDNPHLTPEYEASLLSGPDHYRRAFLDGDWDVTVGSFFGDVFDPLIHVCDPFELPKNWEVFRACDWGSRAPACCLWIAIDNDSNLIVVEELYEPGQTGIYFGKKILEVEEAWGWTDSKGFSKLHGYIDHQGRQNYGAEGPTPTEAMLEMGISWFDADKERKLGWTEIRRRLMERSGPANRTPGLRIFRNCRNLIRTLPNMVAKQEDPDDIDTKQEDHACDSLRFAAMSRPMHRHEDPERREIEQWEAIMQRRKDMKASLDERNPWTGY